MLRFLLLAPFVTYLVAEMAHVSGVIAVVMLGLGISGLSNRAFPDFIKTPLSANLGSLIAIAAEV